MGKERRKKGGGGGVEMWGGGTASVPGFCGLYFLYFL